MTDQPRSQGSPNPKPRGTPASEDADAPRNLEEELATLQAQMRSHIAQSEVRAEEAKTAYDELLTVNEELRSTREKLQSINRGLRVRIDDIGQTNVDLLEELDLSRQQILEQLMAATEKERHRIARELHDEMGQHITALKVGLESLPDSDRVRGLREIAMRLDRSVDRLALELRPPPLADLGFVGALGSLVDGFAHGSGIRADVYTSGTEDSRLPASVEATLYRVLQEALTNVWKHAAAANVSVILVQVPEMVQLIVEDDGFGFVEGDASRASDGLGLVGIRERVALVGGTISIESSAERGTTLYVRVPVSEENET